MQIGDYFNDDSMDIKEDKEKQEEIKLEQEILKQNNHMKFLQDFLEGNQRQKKEILNHLALIVKSCDSNKQEEFIKCFYQSFKENIEEYDQELIEHFVSKQDKVLQIINENDQENIKENLQEIQMDFIFFLSENTKLNVIKSIMVFIENSKRSFTKKILDNQILLMILSLINSQGNQLKKQTGFKLIQILYDLIDSSLLEGFVETQILFELQSNNQIIRHEALLTFFIVIQNIRNQSIDSKFQNFIKKLTQDPYIEIKQTLIKNTPKIIQYFDQDFSLKFILTFFLNQLDSKNRFVKETAFQLLGEVVQQSLKIQQDIFKQATPLLKLVLNFLDLPNSIKNINVLLQEKIINQNVGYLYDVILVYPKEAQFSQLKHYLDFVESLNDEIKIKFKCSIAQQLKNLIKICTQQEQLQLIDMIQNIYLNSNLKYSNIIRERILSDFHLFLFELPIEQRKQFAEFYISILDNQQMQWRLKYAITNIFNSLFNLFDYQTTFSEILPIVFSLSWDNCFQVRKNTCKNFFQLFLLFKEDKQFIEIFKENLNSLATYNWFNIWQSFLYIFQGLLENCQELIPDYVMEIFYNFSNEKVVNNQLLIIDILVSNFNQLNINKNQQIQKILNNFENEKSLETLEKLLQLYQDQQKTNRVHKISLKIKQLQSQENLIQNQIVSSDQSFSSADTSFYQEKKYIEIYLENIYNKQISKFCN